jgi:hypothetical protein
MGKKRKYDKSIPSDADLLLELATLDEVECTSVGSDDHMYDTVPKWAELVLDIKRNGDTPIRARHVLRRHDGELLIQVLWSVLHPERESITGLAPMYAALDKVYDKIMLRVRKGKDPKPEHVGEARGLAMAIALLVNPVKPDIDEVRAVAVERYEARHN